MSRRITETEFIQWLTLVKPYTMVPPPRLMALAHALESIVTDNIPGDIVECGVWKGGAVMLAAKVLQALEAPRAIWLYDTFKGMTRPEAVDLSISGTLAAATWTAHDAGDHNAWCYCPLADVQANLRRTGYPEDRLRYVEGDVVQTLKEVRPPAIAVLRLDTDFYASTRAELDALYPLLAPGGYLLIDDYHDWQGSRRAVGDYFSAHPGTPLSAFKVTGGSLIARRPAG